MGSIEVEVECPYCGESFTVLADPSIEHQTYIEDCFVCCRPIRFSVQSSDGEILEIHTARE